MVKPLGSFSRDVDDGVYGQFMAPIGSTLAGVGAQAPTARGWTSCRGGPGLDWIRNRTGLGPGLD